MKSENKYCVYVHKLLDGTIFYVGSGSQKTRPYGKSKRSKEWFDVTNNQEYVVDIVTANLDKKTSIEKELEIYDDLVKIGNIVNISRPSLPKKYDVEYLRSVLEYSEDSPTKLLWKVTRKANGRVNVGQPAGMVKESKHLSRIAIDGKGHSLHKIVWVICNGNIEDESLVIDHIDGNPFNNSIHNMRLVSQLQNMCNKRMMRNNTTGVCGISLILKRCRKLPAAYRAQFSDTNSKLIQKYFSIVVHGEQEALRLATEWRKARIAELNEQGAGYTSRHGT